MDVNAFPVSVSEDVPFGSGLGPVLKDGPCRKLSPPLT